MKDNPKKLILYLSLLLLLFISILNLINIFYTIDNYIKLNKENNNIINNNNYNNFTKKLIFKKNNYLIGRLDLSNKFFIGKLISSTSTIKLKNLNLKLNVIIGAVSNQPLAYQNVESFLLVIGRSGYIPTVNDIVPYIPGNFPWNGLTQGPFTPVDFTNTGGIYKFPNDLIFYDILTFNTEFNTANPIIINYNSNKDENFNEILLGPGDTIYLLSKIGSTSPITFDRLDIQFSGYFGYEQE
jgi:hypothetical protein